MREKKSQVRVNAFKIKQYVCSKRGYFHYMHHSTDYLDWNVTYAALFYNKASHTVLYGDVMCDIDWLLYVKLQHVCLFAQSEKKRRSNPQTKAMTN